MIRPVCTRDPFLLLRKPTIEAPEISGLVDSLEPCRLWSGLARARAARVLRTEPAARTAQDQAETDALRVRCAWAPTPFEESAP